MLEDTSPADGSVSLANLGGLGGLGGLPCSAWRSLAAAGGAWFFEVLDLYALALTTPALIVALHLSKASAGGLASSSAAGAILGGVALGWVADTIGRVRTLYISVLVYSVFTGAVALTSSLAPLMALRFCGGVGMGGAWAAGAALVAETWPAEHRGKGGSLMQLGLPLGAMAAIGVVAATTALAGGLEHGAWRWVFAIGAVPALLLYPIIKRTPESPVWLARRVSARQAEPQAFSRLLTWPLALGFAFVFFLQYVYWAVFSWTPTFLVTVKHLSFLKGLGYTFAQQGGCLLGFMVFAALVDRVGRRPTFLAYLAVGAAGLTSLCLATSPASLMAATAAVGFGVGGIFSGLGPFTAELLHDSPSRAFSMSLAYNGGRLGGMIAPVAIGLMATSDAGFQRAMLLTSVAFGAAALVVLISPETRGRALS